MEAIIFVGIQGSGKSSFYRERFFATHIRLNLDMLRTRHRESILLGACLDGKQPFVVDNTNATIVERARYIQPARAKGFSVRCYYFRSTVADALARNNRREGRERIPDVGIFSTIKKLEIPSAAEGFDALHYVAMDAQYNFTVEDWIDEVR